MLPQVNDRKLIILANEFITKNPSLKLEDFIDYLRQLKEGKFKPRSDRYNDGVKSYRYVLKMKQDNVSEENWFLHSKPVYPDVIPFETVPPVITNSPKRSFQEMEDEDTLQEPLKKRKLSSNSVDKDVKDYLAIFKDRNDNLAEDLFPFPKKLKENIVKSFKKAEICSGWRILIDGYKGCGKTTFIRSMAKEYEYQYVNVIFSKMAQFHGDLFWIAVEHYVKDHDKALFHFQLNYCSSKSLSSFMLRQPSHVIKNVVIIYECDDSYGLNDWSNESLTFPPLERSDRTRIFDFFLKPLKLSEDIDCEMLAKWTPGFEISEISDIALTLKCENDQLVTKEAAESIIKDFKGKRAKSNNCAESPNVSWDNIGGHESIRATLNKITRELLNENKSTKQSCVLLFGPPGCGKTMIAKALATELEFNFISVCCTDIFDKFQGESEKNVRNVFNKARSCQPCILFFDEFDALCSERDVDNSGSKNNVVNVFLTQLDGMASHKNSRILVLGATNFRDRIDKAILRSGRLGKQVEISIPESSQKRFAVLMAVSNNGQRPQFMMDVNDLVNGVTAIFTKYSLDEYTKGWSPADLAELISESEIKQMNSEDEVILMKHVDSAYCEINVQKKAERGCARIK